MNKLFELIAKCKVYVMRSATYITILNFLMIIATFKKTYNIPISSFILVPCGVIGGLILGWIDYKVILSRETIMNNKQNNVKHQIDRIESKLDQLLKKK